MTTFFRDADAEVTGILFDLTNARLCAITSTGQTIHGTTDFDMLGPHQWIVQSSHVFGFDLYTELENENRADDYHHYRARAIRGIRYAMHILDNPEILCRTRYIEQLNAILSQQHLAPQLRYRDAFEALTQFLRESEADLMTIIDDSTNFEKNLTLPSRSTAFALEFDPRTASFKPIRVSRYLDALTRLKTLLSTKEESQFLVETFLRRGLVGSQTTVWADPAITICANILTVPEIKAIFHRPEIMSSRARHRLSTISEDPEALALKEIKEWNDSLRNLPRNFNFKTWTRHLVQGVEIDHICADVSIFDPPPSPTETTPPPEEGEPSTTSATFRLSDEDIVTFDPLTTLPGAYVPQLRNPDRTTERTTTPPRRATTARRQRRQTTWYNESEDETDLFGPSRPRGTSPTRSRSTTPPPHEQASFDASLDQDQCAELFELAQDYIDDITSQDAIPDEHRHDLRFESTDTTPVELSYAEILPDDITITMGDTSRSPRFLLTFDVNDGTPIFNRIIDRRRR